MQLATGIVIDGKIVLEGSTLPEGARVAVLTRNGGEGFSLTLRQEDELRAAMEETARGKWVDLDTLTGSLLAPGQG